MAGTQPSLLSVPQRQARLLELLRSETFVDAQGLCHRLGVSVATIRRDLSNLELRGLLRRTHGGAVLTNQVARDPANAERIIANSAEKARIGSAIAEMIVEGDAVFIDSSTTTLEVARRLAPRQSLVLITNGIDVFNTLIAGGAGTVYVTGGQYIEINRSFGGPLGAEAVRRFNVDQAVISVSSIDVKRGLICVSSPLIACVQQAMIEIARTVIVAGDHSKFGHSALTTIASLDEVDFVVTDEQARGVARGLDARHRQKLVFV
jgi:DeoR/GlpR family transcriptional regulator of sugar metabolism